MPNIEHFIKTNGAKYLTIEFDANNKWLLLNWLGSIDEEYVKKGLMESIAIALKYKCFNFVHDLTKTEGTWYNAILWIHKEYLPKISKTENSNTALVLTKSIYSVVTSKMGNMSEIKAANAELKLFTDFSLAQKWVRN